MARTSPSPHGAHLTGVLGPFSSGDPQRPLEIHSKTREDTPTTRLIISFFFLLRARLGCAPWPDQPLPHSLNLTSLLIALNAHFVVLLKLQGSVPFFRFLDPPGDFSKSSNLHKLRICFSLRRGAQVNVLWFPDRGSELHLPGGFPSADGCASDEVESNPSLASRAVVSPTAPEPLEPC